MIHLRILISACCICFLFTFYCLWFKNPRSSINSFNWSVTRVFSEKDKIVSRPFRISLAREKCENFRLFREIENANFRISRKYFRISDFRKIMRKKTTRKVSFAGNPICNRFGLLWNDLKTSVLYWWISRDWLDQVCNKRYHGEQDV